MFRYLLFTASFLLLFGCTETSTHFSSIQWQHQFSIGVFEKAEQEDKLVLLTLEANWCHWCHVMEDSTYSNKEVIDYLNAHFICVAVDQDANPELASRYRKYGWPATIVLNSKGGDLIKKAGFMPPKEYLQVLKSAVSGESIENTGQLSTKITPDAAFRNRLEKNFDVLLDLEKGAFTSGMVYVEEESVEYALFYTKNSAHEKWIEKSISEAYNLCDPIWGGVYQYSTHEDWKHPHYEKLLHIQARYMRLFLLDYLYNDNTASFKKAQEIQAYCDKFLLNRNGLYANAQDADLQKGTKADTYFKLNNKDRLKLGIPAIDTNTYTHSNADYTTALLKLYVVTNDQKVLKSYTSILEQLLSRKNKKGLFNHGYQTKETDALRDNLAMSKLLIEHVKFFPQDIKRKKALADLMKVIVKEFKLPDGSFKGFSGELGLNPQPVIEENIPLARVLNWYGEFSKKTAYKSYSKGILTYLRKVDATKEFFHEPGILMLLNDLENEAQHHVSMNEQEPYPLLKSAYVYAPFYSCFEVQKSGSDEGRLLICTSSYCSSPMRDAKDVKVFYLSGK